MSYPKKIYIKNFERGGAFGLPLHAWISEKPEDFAHAGRTNKIAVYGLKKIISVEGAIIVEGDN
jgi:hypothetical protein